MFGGDPTSYAHLVPFSHCVCSRRARLGSRGGSDSGVVGIDWTLGSSHRRLSWAVLVTLMYGQEGSEILTHVFPVGFGNTGKSALQWTALLPTSIILEFNGRLTPTNSRDTTARESRQCRKAGHILAAMEKLDPGALCNRL